jgi:surface polysaccharide O-acyltransferase-like enzyme
MSSDFPEIRYITVLRIIASFAVVVLHVSGYFIGEIDINKSGWWIANSIDSSVRWCVPIFVLISGSLLLNPAKSESASVFYLKRSKRIIVPLVFWSVFYFCLRGFFGQLGLTLKVIIHDIIYGTPYYHLWFLYMILWLYLFSPILRAYVKSVSPNEMLITLTIIFTISSIYNILFGLPEIIIFIFLPYIGYFICGYYLTITDIRNIRTNHLLLTIFICIIITITATGILSKISGLKNGLLLYNYFSPTVIISSIAIFILFINFSDKFISANPLFNYIIGILSPTPLGIYVIHPAVLGCLYKLINKNTLYSSTLLSITIISILGITISIILTLIIIRIPYLRRTVI